ncbi:minor CP 1 [Chimpanzee faeces associated microphage 3]|uniref:minor CP 1 n=1 Tax=Chimpanzee faeces associated microphage 3 TaxID=1676183 RepID=UPI0007FB5CA1|nr:minor CP 1 [Chimpanzee faeces associated microphage 3]AKO71499.1 minor CP 1 [Chimpanzee faeces associated microphage 3]
MTFFTLFNKPSPVGTACNTPSLTIQSEKAQCDINAIIARYKKTGVVDHIKRDQPLYADCEQAITDLEKARILVEDTEEAFWMLPSSVRDLIGEPSNLPTWASVNRSEAEKYGFIKPQSTPPVDSATPPPVDSAANG